MKITEFIKKNTLILDGGMGTLIQDKGLSVGERPEEWNITRPDIIESIHRAYFDAGSNMVCINTFGANILKFSADELETVISAAVKNARAAAESSKGGQKKWIALDVGPTGRMLKPLGDLDFEDAVAIFAQTVRLGVKYGVDLIFIETMSDCYETKAALLAAKENSKMPVFVSNAYGEDGKLMTGADPLAMIALLEGMGADAIGVNCSFGPDALTSVVEDYLKYSSLPVILKPNAGLPRVENSRTVYDLTPSDFADSIALLVERGVRAVGGCCGTTPEYINALVRRVADIKPVSITNKTLTLASSYTHAVCFSDAPVLIGERINPTGKPRFREAVKSGNVEYVLREGIGQEEAGAHILDVNLGIPGIDEATALTDTVCRLQEVTALPLQIDTADIRAMESALRYYNGKAMINSVNGKAESMEAIFPLVKKYGGLVVALTLDENGIPKTAEGRVEIARRILAEAKKYGIDRKNIIFDPLAMAVSADKNAATETLRAVEMISKKLHARTSLGISNVSFGLPARDKLNATFLVSALERGLSAAIVNSYSAEVMDAYRAHIALSGYDSNFEGYIASVAEQKNNLEYNITDLKVAIIKGMKDKSAVMAAELLRDKAPLDIINNEIIPALDTVGDGFEKKNVYLPALLMSAEAAGAAFDVIKSAMPPEQKCAGCRVVIATVKGDIHDIGKNIVKLILENYGFDVTDLGKDVSPEKIVDAVISLDAQIVGLSALMTTTLPAMAETVNLLKKKAPSCKIMVGGAVLTEEYARQIGADFYGRDAMDAVRYIEKCK